MNWIESVARDVREETKNCQWGFIRNSIGFIMKPCYIIICSLYTLHHRLYHNPSKNIVAIFTAGRVREETKKESVFL
jgi:hypothetical protein